MNVDSPVTQIISQCVQAADAGLEAGFGILARLVLYTSSSRFKHCITRTLLLQICLLWHWTTGFEGGTGPALAASLYQVPKHLHNVERCLCCPQTCLSLGFQCRDEVFELKQMFWD